MSAPDPAPAAYVPAAKGRTFREESVYYPADMFDSASERELTARRVSDPTRHGPAVGDDAGALLPAQAVPGGDVADGGEVLVAEINAAWALADIARHHRPPPAARRERRSGWFTPTVPADPGQVGEHLERVPGPQPPRREPAMAALVRADDTPAELVDGARQEVPDLAGDTEPQAWDAAQKTGGSGFGASVVHDAVNDAFNE